MYHRLLLIISLLLPSFLRAAPSTQPSLLLISIDGLRPDYVTDADSHGSKIPTLRALLHGGLYASVHGVLPTATYPSHTTLLTGVSPSKHGIVSNHPFDPANKNPDAWYWFSQDIKSPTLWQAAANAGYIVGSVSWPVSVGAVGPRYNIPEYADSRTSADLKMVLSLAGPSFMAELSQSAGAYITDVENAVPRDWDRTRYAVELIRQEHVRFLTLHLASTDHYQHRSGPFHKTVLSALEEIDKMIAVLRSAILEQDPGAYICIVSDHGFAKVTHSLHLDQAFLAAGLFTLESPRDSISNSILTSWTAIPWSAGGSAEIILRDPNDLAARDKVKSLLTTLAADPANGISSILDQSAIAQLGGDPRASFWLDMTPGFSISSALGPRSAGSSHPTGTHGYLPSHPEMDSLFLLTGPSIPKNTTLDPIDMRSVAPTLANLLRIPFPSADLPPLRFSQGSAPTR